MLKSKSRILLSSLTTLGVLGVGVASATSLNVGASTDAAQYGFLDVKAEDNVVKPKPAKNKPVKKVAPVVHTVAPEVAVPEVVPEVTPISIVPDLTVTETVELEVVPVVLDTNVEIIPIVPATDVETSEFDLPELPEEPAYVAPVEVPVVETPVEPIVEPIVEPVAEPVVEPVVETPAEPVAEPKVEPVVEPVAKPVVEPVTETPAEPAVEVPVEAPVEPAVEAPVEPATEPVAEPVVETPVEPEVPAEVVPEVAPEVVPEVPVTEINPTPVYDANNTYPVGQCTWGVKVLAPWVGNYWGNASQWLVSGAAAGHATGTTPKVGAVAVWGENVAGGYGHVAVVTAVDGDKIQVMEANYGGSADKADERGVGNYRGWFSASASGIQGYVYP